MERADGFKTILYALADGATFLFTTSAGIALLALVLMVGAILRLWSALSSGRLMAEAAGEDFSAGSAIGIALRELGGLGIKAAGALPALAGLAAVLVLAVGLADASRAMDEFVEGQRRISELGATVRNLNRDYRAIEARIDDVSDGRIKATLSFFDKPGSAVAASAQAVDLPGAELYIDAIVWNFDYAEIAAGRRVNLAIPTRVYTDQVAEADGVALSAADAGGVPLIYRRDPGEVYGIGDKAFAERRDELMGLLRDETAGKGAGIVRSVYGNAVHRAAKKGDAFSVWVQQSGGLSIRASADF